MSGASCLSTAAVFLLPGLHNEDFFSVLPCPQFLLWTPREEPVNACKFTFCLHLPGTLYSHKCPHSVFSNLLKILAALFLRAYMTPSIWCRLNKCSYPDFLIFQVTYLSLDLKRAGCSATWAFCHQAELSASLSAQERSFFVDWSFSCCRVEMFFLNTQLLI